MFELTSGSHMWGGGSRRVRWFGYWACHASNLPCRFRPWMLPGNHNPLGSMRRPVSFRMHLPSRIISSLTGHDQAWWSGLLQTEQSPIVRALLLGVRGAEVAWVVVITWVRATICWLRVRTRSARLGSEGSALGRTGSDVVRGADVQPEAELAVGESEAAAVPASRN